MTNEEAVFYLNRLQDMYLSDKSHEAIHIAIKALEDPEGVPKSYWMPDVTVAQQPGHIRYYKCHNCGYQISSRYGLYKYCPNCGAKCL